MYIKFAKIREDAFMPERANPSDAGMDIRTPEEFYLSALHAKPDLGGLFGDNNKVISTGLKVEVPHGYMLEIKNKSSIATRGAIVGACVIDSGYKGELKINLINTTKVGLNFEEGDKIAQAVLTPIVSCGIMEADEEDLYKEIMVNSNRGEGGFGSTGK